MNSESSSPNPLNGSSPTIPDRGFSRSADIDTKTIVGTEAITSGDDSTSPCQIGTAIGKYEIRSQLGAGGMGAVYLGFDTLIEREVAIKVLSHDVAATKIALQRFLQEARSIGKLNHANVVSIYDIDQWNGQYFLVMELLSGGSLAELVDQFGPLPWLEACQKIAQAALGLEAAHSAGMVHRDIKPENLMQTRDGVVKVVDFGLSKLVDAANDTRTAVTKQGQILGTPQYMSPEQFDSTEVDSRTDVYSLGASLFRLLTARFPYQDCTSIVQTMMAHLNKPIPKATEFLPSIPAQCDQIISRAMAKRPIDRYQRASEMAEDLMALIRTAGGDRVSLSPVAKSPAEIDRAPTMAEEWQRELVIPLKSALIIEPSKVLAAIMKDASIRAGASHVDVISKKADALALIRRHVPNLLMTAMQLPDGLSTELIHEICQIESLGRTCVVLNSSDSTMNELIAAGFAASRVLAPKKAKADDIFRVVHAAGPIEVTQSPISNPLDPLNLRLVLLTDFERAPDGLAESIRQVGLLDVAVLRITELSSIPRDEVPTVVLRLRKNKVPLDGPFFVSLSSCLDDSRHLLVELQVESQSLVIRAICRQGVIASTNRILDTRQLVRLLQACRSA